jgi:hypothetical protein
MPVLLLFVMFAIDTAHWWDYSRNLQMRADAAAFAAGDRIGGICASPSPPPPAGSLASIGQVAQLYSGASNTVTELSDLYPYVPVFGSGVAGQANSPNNPNYPNLKAGGLNNYHVLLNSTRFWQPGDTSATQSFTMPGSAGGNFCTTTDEDGHTGPIVDVRVTQSNLRLLLPFLSLRPTISAHARVELQQGVAEKLVRAIAVRDQTPNCVYARIMKASDNSLYKSVTLPLDGVGDPTLPSATLFDNKGASAVAVDMSQGPFYVQSFLSDQACGAASPTGQTYDDTTTSGLEWINTYTPTNPSAGQNPALSDDGVGGGTGGVYLTGTGCSPDQYFTSQACTVTVNANVAFNVRYTDSGNKVMQEVTATDSSIGGGGTINLTKFLKTQVSANGNVAPGGQLPVDSTAGFAPTGSIDVNGASYAYSGKDATHFSLTAGGTGFKKNDIVTQTGDNRWTSGNGGFGIGVESGSHPITIGWQQHTGSTALGTCTNTGGNPCSATFAGTKAQAFGACNGCDQPDDSGPIAAMRIRLSGPPDGPGSAGRNSFLSTATPNLVFETTVQALTYDTASTPPHLLRVSVTTDKQTGLINCGQQPGANDAGNAVQFGCPVVNTPQCANNNYCAPFQVYDPSLHPLGTCNPLSRVAGSPYADCVQTHSENGVKRGQILPAIANLIVNPSTGVCSTNRWPAFQAGTPIPGGDPRAITLVITQPGDLSQNSLTVPIRNFATFYVTGWDATGSTPKCTNLPAPPDNVGNEALCSGSCKKSTLGAIWGHWIRYTDPNAQSNGQPGCPPSFFGVCVPVLSR